jgi:arginase family enzyme
MLTFDKQGLSCHVRPHLVTAIDCDEVCDLSTEYEIHLIPWILDAHIDARPIKDKPHDAILGAACRHASELEANDDASIRKRVSIHSLAETPQEE